MKVAMRDRWGGPEVMALREVETPVPTGDQVLVRVHASSVNRFSDAHLASHRPYNTVARRILARA